MTERAYDLAQVNIALPVEPLDSTRLADFVAALAPINALADASPGFVWRLQGEAGADATTLRGFGDDRILVNMSTWESLEHLANYVYKTAHAEVMRRRREWFVPLKDAYVTLFWVPRGHRPTIQEAEERVARLRDAGPTDFAFTFKRPFPPPGSAATIAPRGDDCPA
jgi:Domain of unknown function (DUF3291)